MNVGARRLTSYQPDETHTLEIEDLQNNALAFMVVVDGTATDQVADSVDIFVEQVAHLTIISGFVRGGVRRLQVNGGIVKAVFGEGSVDVRLDGQSVSADELVSSTGGSIECPTDDGSGGNGGNGGSGGNGGDPVGTEGGLTTAQAVLIGFVALIVINSL